MKTVYHQPKRRSQPLKTLVDGDVRATGLSGMRLPVQTAPIIRSSAKQYDDQPRNFASARR